MDDGAEADTALAEAAPHLVGIGLLEAVAAGGPGEPGLKAVFAKLGLDALPDLDPGVAVVGADEGQQVREVFQRHGLDFGHGSGLQHCRGAGNDRLHGLV